MSVNSHACGDYEAGLAGLSHFAEFMGSPLLGHSTYGAFLKGLVVLRVSRQGLKLIRDANTKCADCAGGDGTCIAQTQKMASLMAETFALAFDLLVRTPGGRLLKPFLRRSASDWEELAEDLAIAADPEVRQLVGQIVASA